MVITNVSIETKYMMHLSRTNIWQRKELLKKFKSSQRSQKVITAKLIKNNKNIDCLKFLKVTKTITMMAIANVSSETKNMKYLLMIKIWQRDELFQKFKNSQRSEKVITAKLIKTLLMTKTSNAKNF